jgi:hypothetical protein
MFLIFIDPEQRSRDWLEGSDDRRGEFELGHLDGWTWFLKDQSSSCDVLSLSTLPAWFGQDRDFRDRRFLWAPLLWGVWAWVETERDWCGNDQLRSVGPGWGSGAGSVH